MSFNIRGGLGMDGRRDTGRIGAVVAALSPDIVCFQEVHQRLPWSGWVDQPRRLHTALGMPVVFQRNLNTGIGGYGVATASRYPILRAVRHFLPSVGERRGALEVSLGTPNGSVSVWCTHWGLSGGERERQSAALGEWIAAATTPVIVCGDCNERADAPAVTRLLERTGLRDCGAEENTPTFPSDAPTARIDFVCYSAHLEVAQTSVLTSLASDHCAVIADFQ